VEGIRIDEDKLFAIIGKLQITNQMLVDKIHELQVENDQLKQQNEYAE